MSDSLERRGPDCPQMVLPHVYDELLASHNALREAVKKYRAACATPNVSYSSRAMAWAEVDLQRHAQCIAAIRDVTALHDVPLLQLPAMIESLLSELADRQIRSDIEPRELWPGCDEIVVQGLGTVPGLPAGDPEDDEWSPEDVVVPRPASDCRGCLRLIEVDGRLTCNEPRSLPWHHATIIWPGPGCVWGKAGDTIYGR